MPVSRFEVGDRVHVPGSFFAGELAADPGAPVGVGGGDRPGVRRPGVRSPEGSVTGGSVPGVRWKAIPARGFGEGGQRRRRGGDEADPAAGHSGGRRLRGSRRPAARRQRDAPGRRDRDRPPPREQDRPHFEVMVRPASRRRPRTGPCFSAGRAERAPAAGPMCLQLDPRSGGIADHATGRGDAASGFGLAFDRERDPGLPRPAVAGSRGPESQRADADRDQGDDGERQPETETTLAG